METDRSSRSQEADLTPGLALACVGSLARCEAGPASDLDLVLLVDPHAHGLSENELSVFADRLWYPVWDAKAPLDHSVRTIAQCRNVAGQDLSAALGLLDLRHVAGDAFLTESCGSSLLKDWRRATRRRLPELEEAAQERARSAGHIAGLLEPDLKASHGGLRDAVLVRALAASSLADRPHGAFDEAVRSLLDVRDALADLTGRRSSRLVLAHQSDVAQTLGLVDADALLTSVYEAGRVIASALDTTMSSALRAARPARRPLTIVRFGRRSAPVLRVADEGVAELGHEIVLSEDAVRDDPALPLRVALAAARTRNRIATVTRGTLALCPVPGLPWSQMQARGTARVPSSGVDGSHASGALEAETVLDLFLRLLDQGEQLVRVWEDLDLADLPARWLPGWRQVRNRPQHNPVHTYTVDRHMVRTAALVGGLVRESLEDGRAPDEARFGACSPQSDRRVLVLSALLHDLGKTGAVTGRAHARVGAERLGPVLRTLGVPQDEAAEITLLVRHHLFLADAAEREPGDPRIVDQARRILGEGEAGRRRLTLLHLLTEADARATGPRAWSAWRSDVVQLATDALARAL